MIRPDCDAAPPLVLSNHGLRHSGGIERYLMTLVQGLHRRGIRPTIVAKRFDTALAEYGWVDAVAVSMFGVPGPLRDFWFDRRLQALKRERHWFPLVALNQTAAADIAICGSTHPGHLASLGRTAGWLDRRKIALERRHLHNARVVVAHSRLLAAQVERYHGIAPEKIEVLHPPVDAARFHPVDAARRAELRERLGLRADRAVFLLASTGHSRKGLDLALRALGHGSRPALLVLAGRPPGVQAPNLRYLGYRTDIEDVYRAADCTLMLSRYEPFGLVGVESVLSGTPLIAAEGVGCLEVLGPAAATAVPLHDAAALNQAIDATLARWQAGGGRIALPQAALGYDPSVDAHLDALLGWAHRLRAAARQAGVA